MSYQSVRQLSWCWHALLFWKANGKKKRLQPAASRALLCDSLHSSLAVLRDWKLPELGKAQAKETKSWKCQNHIFWRVFQSLSLLFSSEELIITARTDSMWLCSLTKGEWWEIPAPWNSTAAKPGSIPLKLLSTASSTSSKQKLVTEVLCHQGSWTEI